MSRQNPCIETAITYLLRLSKRMCFTYSCSLDCYGVEMNIHDVKLWTLLKKQQPSSY